MSANKPGRIPDAIVIVLPAWSLTMLYNYQKIPTSTIQLLVFCVVGVGLAGHIPIYWATIGKLAVVWICAPFVAFSLGFLFMRLLDLVVLVELARVQTQVIATVKKLATSWFSRAFPGVALAQLPLAVSSSTTSRLTVFALRFFPLLLVWVGIAASFVLGANNVSNATGVFMLTHLCSLTLAGLIGGVVMAVGTLRSDDL